MKPEIEENIAELASLATLVSDSATSAYKVIYAVCHVQ